MLLMITALALGDHPRLFRQHRQQTMQLDVAHTDEDALRAHLEMILGAKVVGGLPHAASSG